MTVRVVKNPVTDPRWSELLERHPAASVFHSGEMPIPELKQWLIDQGVEIRPPTS